MQAQINMHLPALQDVKAAAARIKPYVRHTPLLSSAELNALCGLDMVFKAENLQHGGAFKLRGACNAVLSLDDATAAKGVVTHSSGNHAAALSLAASMRGISADVVMPRNAPGVKQRRVRAAGGRIHFCEPTVPARLAKLNELIAESGAHVIHPYNDLRIVCGQATVMLEALKEDNTIDHAIAPAGGGGILSGTAVARHYVKPDVTLWGAEPEGADDAWRSKRTGKITPIDHPKTIADGLLTTIGEVTWPIIRDFVDDIFTVDDGEIVRAMRMLWQYLNIIVEPSAAVPFAVALQQAEKLRNKRIMLIVTGGNVDIDRAFELFKQYP